MNQPIRRMKVDKQINEEIEAKIRRTREIESAIVHSSEKEQAASNDLEAWKQVLSRRENQYSDLSAVYDATKEHIAELEASLQLMENRRDEMCVEIDTERDAFIASCKSFQQQQEMSDRAIHDYASFPRKSDLVFQVETLQKDIKAVRFADEASSRNKMERFRQLQAANAELQNEIDAENSQKEHLLRRINGLNNALANVPGCQDISRLEEDFDLFSEEKRNLEDGIVTLQQQLPLLLSQEQKLGNLLRDQQRALQSLEQKIEEVKLLQEAYENDFQSNLEPQAAGTEAPMNRTVLHNPQRRSPDEEVFEPPDKPRALYGTWDSYQTQPGKRHRII